jgi:hypothetical protein
VTTQLINGLAFDLLVVMSYPSFPEGSKTKSGVGMLERVVYSKKAIFVLNIVSGLPEKMLRRKEPMAR